MDQSGAEFTYLHHKLPSKSDVKLQAEIFVCPEIRKFVKDKKFSENFTVSEKV